MQTSLEFYHLEKFFSHGKTLGSDIFKQDNQICDFLQGPSPVGVDSPHSSSDSYIDESDDEQDGNCTSSGENGRQYECNEKPLQSARESKGSTTCLADIDATINPQMKLRILRKTKAAA